MTTKEELRKQREQKLQAVLRESQQKEFDWAMQQKVLIVTTTVHGMIHSMTTTSLMALQKTAMTEYATIDGFPIDIARNIMSKHFLERTKHDWILFIDSDMGFNNGALIKLLLCKTPIISGLCWQRNPPFHPTLIARLPFKNNPKLLCNYYLQLKEEDMGKPLKVDATGAAFLLVHRNVFGKIKKPYFQTIKDAEGVGNITGEDMYFCDKVSKAGYQVLVDSSVIIQHAVNTLMRVPEFFTKEFLQHGKASIEMHHSTNAAAILPDGFNTFASPYEKKK